MSDKLLDKIQEKAREREDDQLLFGEPIAWSKIKEDDTGRAWVWENFIAKGASTLLSASPKAGKTTLLRKLFVAIKNEEEFAGQPTIKSNILVLSEESPAEWADSREGIEDKDIKHVMIWPRPTRGIPSKKEWEKVIDGVSKKCSELEIDMVVIDTISTFWPVDNENDAAVVKRALVPLFKLTDDNGVAVLIVHHDRKEGGSNGKGVRGSGAITAHVDNIIEFRRPQDGLPNQRTLTSIGRFAQESRILISMEEDGEYKTLGEPWKISKKARKERLLKFFEDAGQALSAKEVCTLWNAQVDETTHRTIRSYIKELLTDGILILEGERTFQGKKVPFYAQSGWKQATLENKNTPPLGAFQGKNTFQAPFQGEGQNEPISLERKGGGGGGEETFPGNTLSDDQKIIWENENEDEKMPF